MGIICINLFMEYDAKTNFSKIWGEETISFNTASYMLINLFVVSHNFGGVNIRRPTFGLVVSGSSPVWVVFIFNYYLST